jgi:hypothetical protein
MTTTTTYKDVIVAAMRAIGTPRTGSSRIALVKHILANSDVKRDPDHIAKMVRITLKRGVEKGDFVQTKQSFRLSPANRKKQLRTAASTTTTKLKKGRKRALVLTAPLSTASTTKNKKKSSKVLATPIAVPKIKKTTTKKSKSETKKGKTSTTTIKRPVSRWIISALKASKSKSVGRVGLVESILTSHRVASKNHSTVKKSIGSAVARMLENGKLIKGAKADHLALP